MRVATVKHPIPFRDWLLVALSVLLVTLTLFMARLEPLFQALFPDVSNPVYRREAFCS
ncbi:hypothetical protein [Modicisalibacter luteus]|uniref:hypothetical protein n=1 Tax=Modicisalibacter luteus TaxID=453962 RepID=UPI00362600F5